MSASPGRPPAVDSKIRNPKAADRHVPARHHEPFLRRLRRLGHNEAGFHAPKIQTWFKLGVAAVAMLAVLPFISPQLSGTTERLATLASLVFLVAALGLWLGLGGRAFLVAVTLVAVVYGLTSWAVFAFPLDDFFVVGLLASFAVFALAGFNLVFVLEEMVYDADARLHLHSRAWAALPTVLTTTLAIGLPTWSRHGGPDLPVLWIAAVVSSAMLLIWWFMMLVNHLQGRAVLRELHLFAIGSLLAAAAAQSIAVLHDLPSFIPSLAAYLLLIGTWVYASYTTLQRTHFLLRGEDAGPWVAILLGASLAIVAHAQVLFAAQGTEAVVALADRRLSYLVGGVWLGIAFYVLRSFGRILAFVRDTRGLGAGGRRVAGRAAELAGTLEGTERLLAGAAEGVLRGIDQVLPGQGAPPRKRSGWELDSRDQRVRRMP